MDTFVENLKLALAQNLGQIRQFVEFREPKELQMPVESKNENDGKEAMLRFGSRATVVVHSARTQLNYVAVKFNWFDEYIETGLGRDYNCFIAKFSSDFSKMNCLGCEIGDFNNAVEYS